MNIRSTLIRNLCLLGLTTVPALSLAESVPIRGPIPFAVFDRDGNGFIDCDEYAAAHRERLELRGQQPGAAAMRPQPPAFEALDLNADGVLSAAELEESRRAMSRAPRAAGAAPRGGMPAFESFDLDGDGVLTEQEFAQARADRIAERAAQGYPMLNLKNAPPFSALDLDGNGGVSPQEFSAHQARQGDKRPCR